MKRRAVIRTIRRAAREAGVDFEIVELTRHTGIRVGDHRSTLGRHAEVDEITVVLFFKQFESVLGKGWWKA
jgi:hypothetical protein